MRSASSHAAEKVAAVATCNLHIRIRFSMPYRARWGFQGACSVHGIGEVSKVAQDGYCSPHRAREVDGGEGSGVAAMPDHELAICKHQAINTAVW